jgi:hypothetical protein
MVSKKMRKDEYDECAENFPISADRPNSRYEIYIRRSFGGTK